MPMCCPGCGLDWSAVGFGLPIRGNVQRGWGSPPTGATAAVFCECLECEWQAYDDRKGRVSTPLSHGSVMMSSGWTLHLLPSDQRT